MPTVLVVCVRLTGSNVKRSATSFSSEPAYDEFTLSEKAVPMTTNPSYQPVQRNTNDDKVHYANM